jgi:hypothetical protein
MYVGRALVKNGDVKAAANTLAAIRVYPLALAESPPPTRVVRTGSRPLDSISTSRIRVLGAAGGRNRPRTCRAA